MACNLLYQDSSGIHKIGTFFNRKKAEVFWEAVKPGLIQKLGKNIQPIYVETGRKG